MRRDEPCEQNEKCSTPDQCCSMRQPVDVLLRERARCLRDKAHGMEVLADELERRRFSREADSMLWSLLVDSKLY